MRDLFPGHYRPTEGEFDRLWGDGVIAFDTNVLLNLYRYAAGTREKLFELLHGLDEQIWLPHQAAWEFQRNRPNVIREQEVAFETLAQKIESLSTKVQEEIDDVIQEGRHPVLDPEHLRGRVREAIDSLRETIESLQEEHPNLLENDPIRERVDGLFAGKVGEPFDEDRLKEIREEGSQRYEEEVPPGYEDEGKDKHRKYGDLILWFQVIEKAASEERPLMLVTDEGKEDWWQIAKGQRVGPRPELVEEVREKAGSLFYLYSPEQFMSYAADRLEQEVAEETLADVQRVSQRLSEFEKKLQQQYQLQEAAEKIIADAEALTGPAESWREILQQATDPYRGINERMKLLAEILDHRQTFENLQQLTLSDLITTRPSGHQIEASEREGAEEDEEDADDGTEGEE